MKFFWFRMYTGNVYNFQFVFSRKKLISSTKIAISSEWHSVPSKNKILPCFAFNFPKLNEFSRVCMHQYNSNSNCSMAGEFVELLPFVVSSLLRFRSVCAMIGWVEVFTVAGVVRLELGELACELLIFFKRPVFLWSFAFGGGILFVVFRCDLPNLLNFSSYQAEITVLYKLLFRQQCSRYVSLRLCEMSKHGLADEKHVNFNSVNHLYANLLCWLHRHLQMVFIRLINEYNFQ